MNQWKVVSKRVDPDPRGGVALVVVCERDGVRREAVVSGDTWHDAEPGREISLADLR
jgi:hypothetical protein